MARRISVRLSAGGTGVRPFSSSFARMKRSTGVERPGCVLHASGRPGRATGWNDQNSRARVGSTRGLERAAGPRVGGADLHPGFEVGDLRGGELRLRRHLQTRPSCRTALMSRLLPGSPGTIAGPGAPPLSTPVAGVEQQLAADLLRLGRVALVAVLDQERADLLLEELDPLGRRGLVLGPAHGVHANGRARRRVVARSCGRVSSRAGVNLIAILLRPEYTQQAGTIALEFRL